MTAADFLANADAPWRDSAERAVRWLAATDRPFTAHDLSELGVPDPDVPSRWGSLFAAMKAAGVIRPVGYLPSPRPSRSGGVCRAWVGVMRAER